MREEAPATTATATGEGGSYVGRLDESHFGHLLTLQVSLFCRVPQGKDTPPTSRAPPQCPAPGGVSGLSGVREAGLHEEDAERRYGDCHRHGFNLREQRAGRRPGFRPRDRGGLSEQHGGHARSGRQARGRQQMPWHRPGRLAPHLPGWDRLQRARPKSGRLLIRPQGNLKQSSQSGVTAGWATECHPKSTVRTGGRWVPHSPGHVVPAGARGLAPWIQQLRLQRPVSKTATQGPWGRLLP